MTNLGAFFIAISILLFGICIEEGLTNIGKAILEYLKEQK